MTATASTANTATTSQGTVEHLDPHALALEPPQNSQVGLGNRHTENALRGAAAP